MNNDLTTPFASPVESPDAAAAPDAATPAANVPAPAGDKSGPVRVRRGNTHDAEALKRAFLDAASSIFAAGGLEAVSMRAVAAAVGVSPMTPYRYYADKAELLTGLWDEAIQGLVKAVRGAVEARSGARARQRAFLESWVQYWEEHPDQYRLVYMTERTTRREDPAGAQVNPVYGELLSIAQDLNRELARELGVSDAHVVQADEMRLVMSMGFLHATMVNRRYPWSDIATLRRQYIDQTLATVEQVLVHGPQAAPDA